MKYGKLELTKELYIKVRDSLIKAAKDLGMQEEEYLVMVNIISEQFMEESGMTLEFLEVKGIEK